MRKAEDSMLRNCVSLSIGVWFVALLLAPSLALAQTAPPLGGAQSFAVLGASTVTNTGPSVITGDVGLSPGTSITGFPPGAISLGTTHAADAVALAAQNSNTNAYNLLAGQICTMDLSGQNLGGLVLIPGVYCFTSSAQLTGALTLNAQGNANSVFVFKTGSTLTTASNSTVSVINGGVRCNVFWQIGSSATLGTGTSFAGNILALVSITLNTGANIFNGRALAQTGAVTLDTDQITTAGCSGGAPPPGPGPGPGPGPVPTLPQAFVVLLAVGLAVGGYMRLRRRARAG
jgi:ice-binding like protein